jgi:hypothetical protein
VTAAAGRSRIRHIDNKEGRAMNIAIPVVAAVSAALILAPAASADPNDDVLLIVNTS